MSELDGIGPPAPSARRSRPAGDRTSNPVRISRIGADRLQVIVRPADGCNELRALVERLEQLIDVGYDAIEVVVEAATTQGLPPMRRPAHRREPGDMA